MYRDDFVLRHIRLFIQAIARVFGLIKEGDLGFALETIRVTFMDYLGMSLEDFLAYPDERMREFLYFGELTVMGLNKAGLAGNMLLNAGLVYRAMGDEGKAVACFEKAVRLLLDLTLSEEEDPEMPDFAPTIDEIVKEVSLEKLAEDTLFPLSFYYDRRRSFRKAHEVIQTLQVAAAGNPDVRDLAESFYVYLLDEPEEELNAGGLTTETVQQALEALRSM